MSVKGGGGGEENKGGGGGEKKGITNSLQSHDPLRRIVHEVGGLYSRKGGGPAAK